MKYFLLAILIALPAGLLLSCGGDTEQTADIKIGELLPVKPDLDHLATFPFRADSLMPELTDRNVTITHPPTVAMANEMTAGTEAPDYTTYDVIGTATAVYAVGDAPFTIEIGQFAGPEDAYGWYSIHRPNGTETEKIGGESFRAGSVRYTYQGDFTITVDGGEATPEANRVVDSLTQVVVDGIEAPSEMPMYHVLFPGRDRAKSSARYYGYGFAGIPGLNDVYTVDFVAGRDTSTFFLSPDSSGIKYLTLLEATAWDDLTRDPPKGFMFDAGFGMRGTHPELGAVVAGLVRQKLVGVIGYDPDRNHLKLQNWVRGLQ